MKYAKKIILVVKVIILIASFGFIAFKLVNEKQFAQLLQVIHHFDYQKSLLLILVLLLMLFNWFSESYKWKLLVDKLQTISLKKSFMAVLSGVTISIFTPNRTGEFAGRVICLEKPHRIKAIFSTFTGNIAQLVTTITAGLVAFSILPFRFKGIFVDSFYTPLWISSVCIALIFIILFFYFNLHFFEKPINQIRFLKPYRHYYEYFFSFTRVQLLKILMVSIIRYTVFSFQFIILLWIFNVNLSFSESIMVVLLIFLVLTAIPSIALGEIGIRGSVSVFLIGQLSENLSGIFMASTTLWIINLAIPALIGSVVISRSKF